MNSKTPSAKRIQNGFTLVELLVVIAIIGILVALLVPAVQSVREAARRTQCANRFRQAGLAIHAYENSHGKYPVGMYTTYTTSFVPAGCDEIGGGFYNGWGWAARILPYIEKNNLHSNIDFSTHNYTASNFAYTGTFVKTFLCPSSTNNDILVECCSSRSNGNSLTEDRAPCNMAGVCDSADINCGYLRGNPHGNGMFFNINQVRLTDVQDGLSNTLLIGEVTGASGRHPSQGAAEFGYFWSNWGVQDTADGINGPGTMPGGRDNGIDPIDGDGGNRHNEFFAEVGFSSWHTTGANFVMADGSVHIIHETIDQQLLSNLTTRAGGEIDANIDNQ